MNVDEKAAALHVRGLQDSLSAGQVAVVLVFDEDGSVMCLCRRPIPDAFELVKAWVFDRLDELKAATGKTPQA